MGITLSNLRCTAAGAVNIVGEQGYGRGGREGRGVAGEVQRAGKGRGVAGEVERIGKSRGVAREVQRAGVRAGV